MSDVRVQAKFLPDDQIRVTITGDIDLVEQCLTREAAESILTAFREANQ